VAERVEIEIASITSVAREQKNINAFTAKSKEKDIAILGHFKYIEYYKWQL